MKLFTPFLGVRTCADQNHFCYVVWRHEDSNSTRHKSGRNVQLMGCFEPSEGCSLEDECLEEVEDDPKPSKHFFCCCRGHLCNSKFEWVHVPKAQQPLVPTNTPPASKTISETFIIAIGFLVLCVIIISFLVSTQKSLKVKKFHCPTWFCVLYINIRQIDVYAQCGKTRNSQPRNFFRHINLD